MFGRNSKEPEAGADWPGAFKEDWEVCSGPAATTPNRKQTGAVDDAFIMLADAKDGFSSIRNPPSLGFPWRLRHPADPEIVVVMDDAFFRKRKFLVSRFHPYWIGNAA